MDWILIAITMSASGQPQRFEQIARFETMEVCEYAPEGLRTIHTGATPETVLSRERSNPWVVQFRCIPATQKGLVEALDSEEKAARFLAGKGHYSAPWWKDRLEHIRAIGKD
jgi:hypothetical protein